MADVSSTIGSVGIVATQTVRLFEAPDRLALESGRSLSPVDVAYETYGKLNADRSNAVLVCHALTGNAHVAGRNHPDDRKPGWWDDMVGPGKGIDTNYYFVICSNVLGGCSGTTGPSSINPETSKPWGMNFPVVTIEDMVKVQKALVEYLGIKRLLAVVGGSMGGMQVLEWAVRYPEAVATAIPIATTARLSAQSIAFDAIGRQAILADPDFKQGQYHADGQPGRGLSIARMIGHITYLSEQGMHSKFGRNLRNSDAYAYDFASEFSVETYLEYQGEKFVERFDANAYLYVTKAMDYYDLTRGGNLVEALQDVRSRFLLLSFKTDWLFPSSQSRQLVEALLANEKDVSYCDLDSPHGHDAFLLEPETVGGLLRAFLAGTIENPETIASDNLLKIPHPSASPRVRRSRVEYNHIEALVRRGSSVLDLGCGDGTLLRRLQESREIDAMGVEVDEQALTDCIEAGLTTVQFDLEHDLSSFVTQSWDYVVLSRTLQALRAPGRVLDEMLRIGRYGIVSFANFGYWRTRLHLLATGRMVQADNIEESWDETSNLRSLTVRDFERYCRDHAIRILERRFVSGRWRRTIHRLPNMRARVATYLIERV